MNARVAGLIHRVVLGLTHRVGTRPRDLAAPPAGSHLKPVPGEPGLPLLGKTMQVLREGQQTAVEYYEKYGPVFWSNSFGQRIVWVVGPDAVQEVLQNKSKTYSQSGWEYFIGPFFTRGLMLLDGQEHLTHRRIMQEAFTRDRLESYLTSVRATIDERVGGWSDGELLIHPEIKQLSLDVATRVFMGMEPGEDAEPLTDAFEAAVRAGTGIVRLRVPGAPFLRWNQGLAGRQLLDDHFRRLLPQKRASDDRDLFAALCHVESEDGLKFSDDDVVNHMIFLMMAAHDTSTITATAMSYYLAKHPEWQEQAREECLALGTITGLADLDQLPTLDLVFQEAMRLVAPVPALVRRTTADTDLAGHHVPGGTMVVVVPGATHLIPDHWHDPESFDPTRYAEPRREHKQHRFVNVPFGGGAHKCIGMVFGGAEVKALLHRILCEYRLEVPEDYVAEWDHTSLVVPVDGLPVTLHRRARARPA